MTVVTVDLDVGTRIDMAIAIATAATTTLMMVRMVLGGRVMENLTQLVLFNLEKEKGKRKRKKE